MNRRSFHLTIALLALMLSLHGQQPWVPLEQKLNLHPTCMYSDTATGLMLVSGNFTRAGDSVLNQAAHWNGATWQSIGSGTGDSNCVYGCNPILSILRHDDDIFVAGTHGIMGGETANRFLSRWDGNQWKPCGNPNTFSRLDKANGNLFALGGFHEISGNPVSRIAKWNGSDWERFGDPVPFDGSDWVQCSEFYKGKYYFGGNFDIESLALHELIAWDGSTWTSPGGGVAGDAVVFDLAVFKGQLFAAGDFRWSPNGNADDFIMAWDGEKWYDPFPLVQYTTQVRKVKVLSGKLYIIGWHYYYTPTGLVGPYGIARWDGRDFCSFGGLNGWFYDIEEYNGQIHAQCDYTLFGDTMNWLARWNGGDRMDYCIEQLVAAAEPDTGEDASIILSPNPATTHFALRFPTVISPCSIRIFDSAGRILHGPETYHAGREVNVEHLKAGLYFVETTTRKGVQYHRLIKH
jgi:hypothetical protein